MADRRFDIVLFGYRNDLARARTLEFLTQLPPGELQPAAFEAGIRLPHHLFAGLEADAARRMCARLEQLGAQVAVLEAVESHAETAQPMGAPPASAAASAVRASTLRPLTAGLLLLLGVAVAVWRVTARPQPRLDAPPLPAAGRLDALPATADHAHQPQAAQLNAEAVQLAEAGRFAEAAQRLQTAVRFADDHPVLQRNLQTVLLNWGVADLNADRLDDAMLHLEQAAQLGERVEVLNGLGVAYLRQGSYQLAASTLERVLQIAPNNTGTMLVLADVYLKQDHRPDALALLQRAREAGVSGPDFDKKLDHLSREVDAEWDFVQLQSPHFQASFAGDEDPGAVRTVLNALEDAYYAVGSKFNERPDGRTAVVLYTQQDFHTVTQTPDWAGGAFDGRIKIPVRGLTADDAGLLRVARHEYAHSLVARLSSGRCPVWLNEGLAVWAEEIQDGERQAWAESQIADQPLFSLDELGSSFSELPARRAEVAYAESYLAVHALIDHYGRRQIPALLSALSTHDLHDAFAAVYRNDLASFEQQLQRDLGG